MLQYDLIITNYVCSSFISKSGCILKYWGLGLQHIFWGDIIQPIKHIKEIKIHDFPPDLCKHTFCLSSKNNSLCFLLYYGIQEAELCKLPAFWLLLGLVSGKHWRRSEGRRGRGWVLVFPTSCLYHCSFGSGLIFPEL